MKKPIFLYDLKQKLEYESIDSLKNLILKIVNYIPTEAYEEVLLMFEKEYKITKKTENIDLLKLVQDLCIAVEDGQYELTWEQDYDNYDYWSDNNDYLSDKDGLGIELQGLLKKTISYVMDERYSEAFQAFELLFSIEIPTEWDVYTIEIMFENELINLDMEEIMLYYTYAMLMTLHDNERVEKLFELEQSANYKLKLCEIVKVGTGQIPNQKKFINQWQEYLMKQNLLHKEHVLIDAIKFEGGIEALKYFVEKHGTKYETSYIDLIKMYMLEKQYDNSVLIAMNALENLQGVNLNRSKIADLLLEIGQVIKNDKFIETGIIEGFYSSLDLKHFLQLYILNKQNVITEAIQYLDKKTTKPNTEYYYMHFLNGDYDLVWTACKKDKEFLGWSSSTKGKMIPLFIALLANEDSINHCTRKLINNSFYNESENFIEVLRLTLKKLSDEDYKKYFNWCLKEIEDRVEAILRGQHRGSYYKISSLIVAMAKAIKSQKDKTGAIQFIQEYKGKYPRHTAFRGCLREDISLAKFEKIF